ncbi:hypothetical protein LCGC14_0739890 [marine sediment metagenome]|uniref:Uncharacterized protein n=1 Tax=marine sediment metagenome TaxID=412755 RepID=A0A0F9TEC1_9ZZZZ
MWYTGPSTTTPEEGEFLMAEESKTKEVSIKPDLSKYVSGVSGSGKKTKRSNDPVAQALDGFTVAEVYAVACVMTDISVRDLQSKYGHLNIGMQRMNLGNRIRGAVAKLDKGHEKDKAVVAGLPTLKISCAKPREAVIKRGVEKARTVAAAKVKADAKAKVDAKTDKGKAEAA